MATPRLRLDGTDLFPYLRVAADDGFQPSSPDSVQPGFGDTVGEGAPLSSLTLDNSEPLIPIHLSVRDEVDATEDVNYCTNPRFLKGTTGWSISTTGSAAAISSDGAGSGFGMPWDARGRNAKFGATVTTGQTITASCADRPTIIEGEQFSVAATVKNPSSATRNFIIRATYYNSGGGVISSTEQSYSLAASALASIGVNWFAPALAASFGLSIIYTAGATGEASTFTVYTASLNKGIAFKIHNDGDSPGWAWDGVPHASTSRGPAVPYTNMLHNPRPTTTMTGWSAQVGADAAALTVVEDATSPTGSCLRFGYSTSVDLRTLNDAAIDDGNFGCHVLPGNYLCFAALIKANAAAQAGLTSANGASNITIKERSTGIETPANIVRNNFGWQWVYVTVQAEYSLSPVIRGRGGSVLDADVRFAQFIAARGQTRADAEAQAAALAANSFFDGDSLDGEWVTPIDSGLARPQAFSHRYVGKDGLHRATAKLEQLCGSAINFEWRDDGASKSTFRDVLAARFEHAYSYRRAQRKWLSGIIHLWTRPVAHSGTFVAGPTGVSSGYPFCTATGAVARGDRPADLDVIVRVGSVAVPHGRIVGAFAAPYGRKPFWSAASLTPASSVHLDGASGAAGSQILRWNNRSPNNMDICSLTFPASSYRGRSRVLGVARAGAYSERLYTVDNLGNRLSPGSVPSHLSGYGLVDLGVLDVGDNPNQSNVTLSVLSEPLGRGYQGGLNDENCESRLSQIMLIPEDSLSLVVDTQRRLIAWDDFRDGIRTVDQLGNSYDPIAGIASRVNFAFDRGVDPTVQGVYAVGPGNVASGYQYSDAVIRTPTVANIEAALGLVYNAYPSGAFKIGKYVTDPSTGSPYPVYAKFHIAATQVGVLSLWSGTVLHGSVSIPSIHGPVAGVGAGQLIFRSAGNQISAELRRSMNLTFNEFDVSVGSLFQNNASHAEGKGQPFIEGYAGNIIGGILMRGMRVTELPTITTAPRDVYQFSPSGTVRSSAASVLGRKLAPYGALCPQASPGVSDVHAFSVSLHDGRADDIVSVQVRVRERFTYAR